MALSPTNSIDIAPTLNDRTGKTDSTELGVDRELSVLLPTIDQPINRNDGPSTSGDHSNTGESQNELLKTRHLSLAAKTLEKVIEAERSGAITKMTDEETAALSLAAKTIGNIAKRRLEEKGKSPTKKYRRIHRLGMTNNVVIKHLHEQPSRLSAKASVITSKTEAIGVSELDFNETASDFVEIKEKDTLQSFLPSTPPSSQSTSQNVVTSKY